MIQRFDQLAVALTGTRQCEALRRRCRPGNDGRKIGEMSTLMNYTFQSSNFRPIRAQSGSDFHRAYLKQSGVPGPEKLNATMDKVQSKVAHATLKRMAATALPLIKTHLQVKDLG